MTIAKNITETMKQASWIRKMFEQGIELKKQYGPENVFDFTLGNPNLEPPTEFKKALKEVAIDNTTGLHGYMPNNGYEFTREAIAKQFSLEQNISVPKENIIMTCGAAGALNVILKTLLDPGNEVLVPCPYFAEYKFYVENHNGIFKTALTNEDLSLNITTLQEELTPQTKVVLINTPNNPTGQVYSAEQIKELSELLKKKSAEFNSTIYLVSDEPYRKIIYDNTELPSVMKYYENTIIATSYSKDLSVPGERIGYIVIHPQSTYQKDLLAGMTLTNRTLGFVNASAFMQRVIAKIQGSQVDTSVYRKKRDLLCDGLEKAGYNIQRPKGAFYLFMKTPIADDIEFVKLLQKEQILAVPGSGFGASGHIRISYCVADNTIINSLPGFKKVLEKCKQLA